MHVREVGPGLSVGGYGRLGASLVAFGIPLTLFSWFILLNTALTALGLACIIIGVTALMMPPRPVPSGVLRAMVEAAAIPVEALLEEFDVEEPAVYLPPRDGRVYVFAALASNHRGLEVDELGRVPVRVVNVVGRVPGLMLFPPGSELVRLSGLEVNVGLEEAVRSVLVDLVEGAESVSVAMEGDSVVVEIEGCRLRSDWPKFRRVLGSPAISIAGCSLAYVLNRALRFRGEEAEGRRVRGFFAVVS